MLRVAKRSYDEFSSAYNSDFGYNKHAGANVERLEYPMDGMEEYVPKQKRSKYESSSDDESNPKTNPSTQSLLSERVVSTSLPKIELSADYLLPSTWLKALPRARRYRHEITGSIASVSKSEGVFSVEDVSNILSAALQAQAERLHMEYQVIIGERIGEIARVHEQEKEMEIQAKFRNSDTSYFS